MTEQEELAACYRLSDQYGLSDLIFGHISVKKDNGYFVKDPMLPFSKVTADNLIYIDFDDSKKSFGDFNIHNYIYKNSNCNAIMHIHTDAICAMACSKESLLNLSQPSVLVNTSFAEYEYESNLLFDADYSNLINIVKEFEFVLMKNHGFITTGKSLLHVFFNSYIFDKACKIQLLSKDYKKFDPLLMKKTREIKLILKYYQTRNDLWKNLIKGV